MKDRFNSYIVLPNIPVDHAKAFLEVVKKYNQ